MATAFHIEVRLATETNLVHDFRLILLPDPSEAQLVPLDTDFSSNTTLMQRISTWSAKFLTGCEPHALPPHLYLNIASFQAGNTERPAVLRGLAHTWNLHRAFSNDNFSVQKVHNPVTDGVLDCVIACSSLSCSGRIWKLSVLLIHQPLVHGPAQKQDIMDINKWTHTQGSDEPAHTSAHSRQPQS